MIWSIKTLKTRTIDSSSCYAGVCKWAGDYYISCSSGAVQSLWGLAWVNRYCYNAGSDMTNYVYYSLSS